MFVFIGAGVLTACSAVVAGVAYNLGDGGQQVRSFRVQQLLLVGGIAFYCAGIPALDFVRAVRNACPAPSILGLKRRMHASAP